MLGKKKDKLALTKLHFYFLILGGALMFASSNIEYGYVDSFMGIMAGTIFFTALLVERYTGKIEKNRVNNPKQHGLKGALIGCLIGGGFSGVINVTYNLFDGPSSTEFIILSILIAITTGVLVGFFLNYITMKRDIKPILPTESDNG
ncbi:MAG: hypothetical protein ACOC53_05155 [Candidatus Saliniplasma sp.]